MILTMVVFLPLCFGQNEGVLVKPGLKVAPPVGGPAAGKGSGPYLDPEFSDSFSLFKDDKYRRRIEAVVDYINEENWVVACDNLQNLVELKEDVFVPLIRKGPGDKQTKVWVAVKSEADRLIATLPPKGKDHYQLTFGPPAAKMLKDARAENDIEMLRQVMNRYIHTEAGVEATNLLGSYYLDRGIYITASRCYEQLLNREAINKLTPSTLLKAAYAFHMAENRTFEDRVWKELNTRGASVTLGGERRNVSDLQDHIAGLNRGMERSQTDWPLFGGNPSHTARGEGDNPFLEAQWREKLGDATSTEEWIKKITEYTYNKHSPLLPVNFPITVTITKDGKRIPLVVYRSHGGLVAVNVKTGKLAWKAHSEWSMDSMFKNTSSEGKANAINTWANHYFMVKPKMVFDNSTIGSLSTDGNLVFAVEDLAVPPPQTQVGNPNFNPGIQPANTYSPRVNGAIQHNQLVAYNLSSGKLIWHLGSHDEKIQGEFSDTYFLGPPMPIDGKLYALADRQQELHLITLNPASGKLLSSQTLGNTKDRLTQAVTRRIQAAHLAFGEGMLVCPTNAGALLGVNLLTNRLVWAYPYREGKSNTTAAADELKNQPINNIGRFRGGRVIQPGMPGMIMGPNGQWVPAFANLNWQVTAPIIQDNKVVFTAPDATAVHCINLNEGSSIWTHNRGEDDLFLAGVFNGKVIIVGKRNIRALSLSKGEQLWNLEVGMPSGQGVASDNIYYLPLQEGLSGSREPEVCAIDMEKGMVLGHSKSRKKEIPGNLLFFEGVVLSQTLADLTAYPQLKVKLAQIDDLISKNPEDPLGLTERGELRLDKGDRPGAIADLLKALKNKPTDQVAAKAREKLYDALTEHLQHNFNDAEKYLADYEPLCHVQPAPNATEAEKSTAAKESRRRRVNFLSLVAKGKESQHKLVEAFDKYVEFAELAPRDELISVIDEPSVHAAADVWSQGRIRAMAEAATPEERKPLEDRVMTRWSQVNANNNIEEMKKFVSAFGSVFKVGKEARLKLAERMMEEADPAAILEAERNLNLLRGRNEEPEIAARALECLARLNVRNGLLKDAAYYYRLLRAEYPRVVVADGKTGSQIFDEQAADKRILPFLDTPADRMGLAGKPVRVKGLRDNFPYQIPTYRLGQMGEPLPYFQENQLSFRHQPQGLRVVDSGTGEEKWSINLTQTQFANLIYGNGAANSPRYSYLNLGHLVVIPLGQMLVGIDPINRKVLWEKNLNPVQGGQNQQPPQLQVDPRDGAVLLIYPGPDPWVQRLGSAGPLEANVICVQSRDALMGIDPVNGRILWTRSDVSSNNQIFGDDQTLYVVEMNNENHASSTRALRIYDGVTIKNPDFAPLFEKRVGLYGRNLLVADSDATGSKTLRIHDVATDKDLWKNTFPPNSIELKSELPYLGGMIEPDGKVKVVNLKTGKEVLNGRVDPKHLSGAVSVSLLADSQDYYIAINGPPNQQIQQFGGVQSILLAGTGIRSVNVNGVFYCFKGDSGKVRWWHNVPNQTVVLEEFRDLPFVLFTAQYQELVGGRSFVQTSEVKAIDKNSGKLIYATTGNEIPNRMNFHSFYVDRVRGVVDLIGFQMKVSFNFSGEAASK